MTNALADRLEKYARDVSNSYVGGSQHTCDCDEAARLLRACAQRAQTPSDLESRILQYADDLRHNRSGGDDYPWKIMTGVADYLEILVRRSHGQPDEPLPHATGERSK